jgi:hypothetical protein
VLYFGDPTLEKPPASRNTHEMWRLDWNSHLEIRKFWIVGRMWRNRPILIRMTTFEYFDIIQPEPSFATGTESQRPS